jgi:hypothetical protein
MVPPFRGAIVPGARDVADASAHRASKGHAAAALAQFRNSARSSRFVAACTLPQREATVGECSASGHVATTKGPISHDGSLGTPLALEADANEP